MSDQETKSAVDIAADRSIKAGRLLLVERALANAVYDDRLDRADLRIIACICMLMRDDHKAEFSRAAIVMYLGLAPKTVSNRLSRLRVLGYIVCEPIPGTQKQISAFGDSAVRLGEIEAAITAHITKIRANNVPPIQGTGQENVPSIRGSQNNNVPPIQGSKDNNVPPIQGSKDNNVPPIQGTGQENVPCIGGTNVPPIQGTSLPEGNINQEGSPHTGNFPAEGEQTFPLYGDDQKNAHIYTKTLGKKKESKKDSSRARGTRLEDGWRLPKSWGEWALNNFHVTPEEVRNAAASFRDHWHSQSGAKAKKVDWQATWRNWCRNSIQGWKRRANSETNAVDASLLEKQKDPRNEDGLVGTMWDHDD